MTTQTRIQNKLEKAERFKGLQEESARRSEGSNRGSAGSEPSVGDQHHPVGVRAYAGQNATTPLSAFTIQRRTVGARDVQIDILYCGVCHSDLHQVRNEWHNAVYPCVPGHEIVGRVVNVGREVTKFKAGALAAVGCMVDSCRTCSSCHAGYEQYCEHGPVFTYNSPDTHLGGITYGGYSESIVVDEAFVLRVAENLDPATVAPLVCAGITTYSPLRHWKVGKGQKVGIVGLGGLGHMAVKFANAFGAHVVLFTTSPNKEADALRLGAHEVVVSKDASAMNKHLNTFDFILDAVSANHDINGYLQLLKRDGTMTLVGIPEKPLEIAAFNLILPRRQFAGSGIGGIAETQEMLDYCADQGIVADVEMIRIDQVNEAYQRMLKGQVKYRFVIDMESL
jgi:alcohol dehydrogenase (NADP+)